VRDEAADFFQGPEMGVLLGRCSGIAHAVSLPDKS
jgi:hypothetical protein